MFRKQTSSDGNLTRSILTYHPTLEDQGKFLSCRAEQTLILESGIEQGFKLDIHREYIFNIFLHSGFPLALLEIMF